MTIESWLAREQQEFVERHPLSRAHAAAGTAHYLYGVPSHWMRRWAGGFPLYAERARGASVWCVDGHEYVDFCLGDTGGMCGHAAPAVTAAVAAQMDRGATTLLPTAEAAWVGEELARRFRVPYWGFTTSATDANRAAIRIARMVTGREVVLVFNGCYHGSVEEAHVALAGGQMVMRSGVHPNAVDHARVSRVVEFNDLAALEAALAPGDVAVVLAEPCMTNYGMIEAQPGFLAALRALTARNGTLLVIDETHTWSAGPGGYTGRDGLDPDLFVLGKAAGGGVPVGLYGLSAALAARLWDLAPREGARPGARSSSHMGFGGTLAGSALQVAAVRAVLAEVLTAENFARMIALATHLGRALACDRGGVRPALVHRPERGAYRSDARARSPTQRLRGGARAQRHPGEPVPSPHAQPGGADNPLPQHAAGVPGNNGRAGGALPGRIRSLLPASYRAAGAGIAALRVRLAPVRSSPSPGTAGSRIPRASGRRDRAPAHAARAG